MIQANVIATSGLAVEAAGDVDVLLLDKTGTITLGNREATDFIPAPGVSEQDLADAAQLSSLADETPEGRSIVVLAKEKYGLRGRDVQAMKATFIPFSAHTRMSGVDFDGRHVRKGAADAIAKYVSEQRGSMPADVQVAMPTLLVNQVRAPNHWIGLRTIGTKSNRDGIGARITLKAGFRTLVEEVRSGSSYDSNNDMRVHFGLGSTTKIDFIQIRWPSGLVERFENPKVDSIETIKEGSGTPLNQPKAAAVQ